MIQRYTRPVMARIWAEERRLKVMLRVSEAFLEVLAAEKGIPGAELKALKSVIQRPLLARTKAQEARCGHEVIGMLSAVAEEIKDKAPALTRYLHYGLTSSDILDTVLAIQLRDSASLLILGWEEVASRLRSLSRKHELAWMAGRTHGVHAEPVTFGVKLAGWHAEAQRSIDRLRRAREVISYGKLSGAVGAYAHVGPEAEAKVCAQLGLRPEPAATQVVPRDRHADYLHALVLSAAALERFATEIRHLQRTEVLEVSEPFTKAQKGSSAMPHKKNPVLCENLCGLSRLIRSYAGAAVENIVLWHERDISHSSVERVILPDSCLLLDFMLARFRGVLDGLRVDPKRMRENLDLTRGLVFSQKVLLRLVDAGLDRLKAYELVQRSAFKASESRGDFLRILSGDPVVTKRLSKEELESCFDLDAYKGPVREILRRSGVLEG